MLNKITRVTKNNMERCIRFLNSSSPICLLPTVSSVWWFCTAVFTLCQGKLWQWHWEFKVATVSAELVCACTCVRVCVHVWASCQPEKVRTCDPTQGLVKIFPLSALYIQKNCETPPRILNLKYLNVANVGHSTHLLGLSDDYSIHIGDLIQK